MANSEFRINHKAVADINNQMLVALEQTANALLADVVYSQTMPFDTGTMQNGQTGVDASKLDSEKMVEINTSAPQARRLYFHPEYNFQKGKNPNAGGLWWEPYINGDKKGLPEQFYSDLLKRRLAKYDS